MAEHTVLLLDETNSQAKAMTDPGTIGDYLKSMGSGPTAKPVWETPSWQAGDPGLTSLSGLTWVSDSFIKMTAADTYAVRTIAETKTDLSLNNVDNVSINSWAGSSNIITVGTLTVGTLTAGVGIGIARTEGTLHVHTATAGGSVTASVNANDLVVENSGHTGISILSPDASYGIIYFGTNSHNIGAAISWQHNNDTFNIGTDHAGSSTIIKSGADATAITISSTQVVTFANALADGQIASASTWSAKIANLSEDSTPSLGGPLACGSNWVGYTETTVTYNVTTTTVDWNDGNKARVTMTGNIGTMAFTNPPTPGSCLLVLVHSGAGRLVTTWDADIKWVNGGAAPTLSLNSGDEDIVSFYFDGTSYYGTFSKDFD